VPNPTPTYVVSRKRLAEIPQEIVRTGTDEGRRALTYRRPVAQARTQESGITVVVADRHPLVRRALTDLIDVEPGFAVVAQASDAGTAASELRTRRPKLLLLEPLVLGDAGLRHLPGLLDASPVTRAVVLADEDSSALDRHAHGLGAVATILKHAAPDELFRALRHAVALPPRGGPLPATEG
jgi:two-component system nitrate/nitrite response regulator NarL